MPASVPNVRGVAIWYLNDNLLASNFCQNTLWLSHRTWATFCSTYSWVWIIGAGSAWQTSLLSQLLAQNFTPHGTTFFVASEGLRDTEETGWLAWEICKSSGLSVRKSTKGEEEEWCCRLQGHEVAVPATGHPSIGQHYLRWGFFLKGLWRSMHYRH